MSVAQALSLAGTLGWPVFPCNAARRPLTARGFKDATTDANLIRSWWGQYPEALVAIPTGKPSGLYVLDLDTKNGKNGFNSLKGLGYELPEAARINWTPSGGAHYLFQAPPGERCKTDASYLGPGIDRRGDGGYIIWWPAAGGLYTEGPIALPPPWMMTEPVILDTAPMPAPNENAPIGLTDVELRNVLDALDVETYTGYDKWFTCGAALHHETQGTQRGLELWDEISRKWPKYPGPEELLAKYRSFGSQSGAPRTLRSILPPGWTRDPLTAFSGGVIPASPPVPLAPDNVALPPVNTFAPQSNEVLGNTFLTPQQQQQHFTGCVYVASTHRVMIPTGYLLDQGRFDVIYGGYAFAMDPANTKVAKGAWEAFTRNQAIRFPRVDKACFRPEIPAGQIINDAGTTLVNTYVPIETRAYPGDVKRFRDHLGKLFPVEMDRDIILAYLAALVQFPGDKFQWCPVIQGMEGNGKTIILEVAEYCVGERYAHRPNATDLTNKFTGWLDCKVLIGIEEINTSQRREILEVLKPLITNKRVEIQGKGQDQITGDNRANFLLFSNYKDAVTKTRDGRRYAIFYTAQQVAADLVRDGMDGMYFPKLYDWLREGGFAAINHYLKTYKIPKQLNPAINHGGICNRAPVTSSLEEAVEISLGALEQEVMECIARDEQGFRGGYVSSVMVLKRLRETRRANISQNALMALMKSLGFVPHPSLDKGRTTQSVMPDGCKTQIWVKEGHISCNFSAPAVGGQYTKAQGILGYEMPDAANGTA